MFKVLYLSVFAQMWEIWIKDASLANMLKNKSCLETFENPQNLFHKNLILVGWSVCIILR